MAKNEISFENAQAFEAAIKAMPTVAILKTLVFEAAKFAEARAARRPAEMGATPGTSGLHSTGNVPTPLRAYYQRGFGRRYVPGFKNSAGIVGQTGKTRGGGGKKSEKLKDSWRRERSGDSMQVEVLTEVSYAGYVQGGTGSSIKQTGNMDKRGWETIDEVAVAVEDNIGRIMAATVARQYQQWFKRYGIDSTTST